MISVEEQDDPRVTSVEDQDDPTVTSVEEQDDPTVTSVEDQDDHGQWGWGEGWRGRRPPTSG